MSAVQAVPASEFDEVYRDLVVPVWRYVRSRIPGHHEAQDVTSDVFVRTLQSWPGYDPARGPARAWVFRIAQRAVADWWRSQRPELAVVEEVPELDLDAVAPEDVVLSQELLSDVRVALDGLGERERDVVALRFGAGLKHAEVAEVLGTSPAAAKMLLGRTLGKLRQAVPADSGVHLMAAHRPSVPPELPDRIEACLQCERGKPHDPSGGPRASSQGSPLHALFARLGVAPGAVLGWALVGPLCISCAVPALWPLMASMGLLTAFGFVLHTWVLGLVLPVFAWVLWRHSARHRDPWVMIAGGAGVALLASHFLLHFVWANSAAFDTTGQLGAVLLTVAIVGNAFAIRRWLRAQRTALGIA